MPQASDEQRALMAKWFPVYVDGPYGVTANDSGIADGPPAHFLLIRGWIEINGMWHKPTPAHSPSIYEVECLRFLRDEWDYDFHRPLYEEAV